MFIQEHWLLRDKLHLLQNISEEFIVFSKSSIDDGKLLIGRPYACGTAIFIRKSIKCTITNCDIECDRFNAMLVDFYNFTVLIIGFYTLKTIVLNLNPLELILALSKCSVGDSTISAILNLYL